jgi:hypothetical protein
MRFTGVPAQFIASNGAGVIRPSLSLYTVPPWIISRSAIELIEGFIPAGRHIQLGAGKRKEFCMRSDLIFGALTHVTNRYELCQLASKATRKLHKPNTRLQDTTNEVLDRFKDALPVDAAAEHAVQSVHLDQRKAA